MANSPGPDHSPHCKENDLSVNEITILVPRAIEAQRSRKIPQDILDDVALQDATEDSSTD